jgi:hypothetical protein
MGTLASTLIALILPLSGDFRVTWYFDSQGCTACHLRQIEMMHLYFDGHDEIVIIGERGSKQVVKIKNKLSAFFDRADLEVSSSDRQSNHATGFSLSDPVTGERFSYSAHSGTYNTGRAEIILSTFRDRN